MIRFIFITGLVLICFSIVNGIVLLLLLLSPKPAFEMIFLPQPSQKCECAGGPAPRISEVDSSTLAIVGELPKQMDRGTSETILVKLTYSTPHGPDNYPSSNKDITVLHPDISTSLRDDIGRYCFLHFSTDQERSNCNNTPTPNVKNLFGPGYELFAIANIIATSFDVQLLSTTEQSTDQTSIEWIWNISPKSGDDQSINQSINEPINLDVDLHWKPVSNSGKEDIFRQIWEDNPTISVDPLPFFARGQVTLSGFLAGLTGIIFTGLSFSWVYDQRKKRQEEKEKNKGNILDASQSKRAEELLGQERVERERVEELLRQERMKCERVKELLRQERVERVRKLEHVKRERVERERRSYLYPRDNSLWVDWLQLLCYSLLQY